MPAPRRILLLSASAGAGHLRAAQALESACRQAHPQAQVRQLDTLELTPRAFRTLYAQKYLEFVNKAPELLGLLYERTNRPPKSPVGDRLRLLAERLNTRPFVKFVREFEPDVVVHTHFLPAAILAHEAGQGRLAAPQAVVVTDFDVHRFWLQPGVARYFVSRPDNALHLAALGVPRERVATTGIPIDPLFAQPPDREALRRKHAVEAGRPLVLVSCGGFGVGPIESLVDALVEALPATVQLVIVAGRNEALRGRLERRARGARVLGFTTEMHEWMALADLLVSKPGGLTTSEALACGLPLVVANPIPGQETRNATMLFEEGAAMSGENPYTVGPRVARLLADPRRLARLRDNARRLGRPRAALDVARQLPDLLPAGGRG